MPTTVNQFTVDQPFGKECPPLWTSLDQPFSKWCPPLWTSLDQPISKLCPPLWTSLDQPSSKWCPPLWTSLDQPSSKWCPPLSTSLDQPFSKWCQPLWTISLLVNDAHPSFLTWNRFFKVYQPKIASICSVKILQFSIFIRAQLPPFMFELNLKPKGKGLNP